MGMIKVKSLFNLGGLITRRKMPDIVKYVTKRCLF